MKLRIWRVCIQALGSKDTSKYVCYAPRSTLGVLAVVKRGVVSYAYVSPLIKTESLASFFIGSQIRPPNKSA